MSLAEGNGGSGTVSWEESPHGCKFLFQFFFVTLFCPFIGKSEGAEFKLGSAGKNRLLCRGNRLCIALGVGRILCIHDKKRGSDQSLVTDNGCGVECCHMDQPVFFKDGFQGRFNGTGSKFFWVKILRKSYGTRDFHRTKPFHPKFFIGRNHGQMIPDSPVVHHAGIITNMVHDLRRIFRGGRLGKTPQETGHREYKNSGKQETVYFLLDHACRLYEKLWFYGHLIGCGFESVR